MSRTPRKRFVPFADDFHFPPPTFPRLTLPDGPISIIANATRGRHMKLLTFLAKSFCWTPGSRSLIEAPEPPPGPITISDTVVVFMEVENSATGTPSVLRQTLKHIKWLANKKRMRNVVVHSFAHLGGESAPPGRALQVIEEVAARLRQTGYNVWTTPFGYFCEWDISVHGDSIAKVWKEI